MKSRTTKKNLVLPKRILRLPDLDHAKVAVLHSSSSPDSQRSYRFAMDDFIAWYCSEPRLAFNRTVVLRYRLQLESRHLAASTVNLRLAAVRRLAYEAADSGHVRTVPVPGWVKSAVDTWISAAGISCGRVFRCVSKIGSVWGTGITEKVVWSAVRECATKPGLLRLAPHDLRAAMSRRGWGT